MYPLWAVQEGLSYRSHSSPLKINVALLEKYTYTKNLDKFFAVCYIKGISYD